MSYSNYATYSTYFQKRGCRPEGSWGRENYDSTTYSSNDGWYYGPWEWFPRAAKTVLEWFLEPPTRHDHQALYKEITTGDDFDGFLDYGQKQDGLIKFYVLLCVTALLAGIMFLGGLGWKLFGKKKVDSNDDMKSRVKLVPLFLFHIPVVIVLGLLLAIFSMNLWALYTNMSTDYDRVDAALNGAHTDLSNMIKRGNCEYESGVVEGAAAINKKMEDFFVSQLQNCSASETFSSHLDNLQNDKELLSNLKESAQSIGKQLIELKDVIMNEAELKGLDDMSKVLNKLRDELEGVYKGFDAEITDAKASADTRKANIENLHNKLTHTSQPLTFSLEEIQKRLKVVVDAFHSAVTEETKWIDVVGDRMRKMKDRMKQEGDPLPSFIISQFIISMPVLFTIFALTVAFFALGVRIVYPVAYSKFPGATKKTQRFLTTSFFTQCALVGYISLVAWVSLNYAGSVNVACKPMYSTGYYSNPMSNFYKDVLGNFVFKDFEGREINQTFADSVALARSGDPITNIKNANLIPKLSERVDFDQWLRDVQKTFRQNPVLEVQFQDRTKISKDLPFIVAEFKDHNSVLLVRNSQSMLARLVAKQLENLEKQLDSLSLKSLNAVSVKGCESFSETSIARILQNIFDNSIDQYEQDFKRRRTASFIYHSYMGVGRQLCVDWRYPMSGLWLAGTLLCFILLVSAFVLFKVSKNLNSLGCEDKQVIPDSTTVTTIYEPLIDGEKNPAGPTEN